MWNLKFRVTNLDSIYTRLTRKYEITDYFYPFNYYKKNNRVYILGSHVLEGDKKEIEKFVLDLKKNRKTKNLERSDNIIIVLMAEEEKFYELLYDPKLFHPSPVLIRKGKEEWNIASWSKEALVKIIDELAKWKTKFKEFELLRLKMENLKEIYFPRILPEIPERQKQAFILALENGYYDYPRKITLTKLAKIMNVSISTFQEHLRKAEARLLPFFAKSLQIS